MLSLETLLQLKKEFQYASYERNHCSLGGKGGSNVLDRQTDGPIDGWIDRQIEMQERWKNTGESEKRKVKSDYAEYTPNFYTSLPHRMKRNITINQSDLSACIFILTLVVFFYKLVYKAVVKGSPS